MGNWRTWKLGDTILFKSVEFDGTTEMVGNLVEIDTDHAIVESCGSKLWLDDDTCYMFSRINI